MNVPTAGAPTPDVAHWFVTGTVQGVGFRWHVAEAARRLGVRGWVRNLEDGRVEILAAGSTAVLRRLADAVRAGPPGAQVTKFEEHPAPATDPAASPGAPATVPDALPGPFAIRR